MIIWRIGIPWTNHEDAQDYVDWLHKEGVKVTGYGTLTCTTEDENHYIIVYDLVSSELFYNRMKKSLTEYKEIYWRKQKLLLPKGVIAI